MSWLALQFSDRAEETFERAIAELKRRQLVRGGQMVAIVQSGRQPIWRSASEHVIQVSRMCAAAACVSGVCLVRWCCSTWHQCIKHEAAWSRHLAEVCSLLPGEGWGCRHGHFACIPFKATVLNWHLKGLPVCTCFILGGARQHTQLG